MGGSEGFYFQIRADGSWQFHDYSGGGCFQCVCGTCNYLEYHCYLVIPVAYLIIQSIFQKNIGIP